MPEPSTASFVGRDDELAGFERAVVAARRGSPGVLLIGGDAGIGKSALVAEASRRTGAHLWVGRCLPMGGEAVPSAPLIELFDTVRRRSPDAPAGLGSASLDELLSAPTGPGGGHERTSRLFRAALELVRTVTQADAAIVAFEDLHWADALSWDLFDFLSRNLLDEPVVLVGTYRPSEVRTSAQRRRMAEITRLPIVERIELGGLTGEDVAVTVDALLGRPAPPRMVEEILRRAQGNPFFIRELVSAHVAGETIPAVLSDLVATDLAELDAHGRAVLEVLAAVGHAMGHEELERVVELDGNQLEQALRSVIDAHFVVVDDGGDAYRLRHALIGEVLYADLLPPLRRRIHRRLADALAEQPPETLRRADRAGELAFHLDRSGDQPAAFAALLAAADAAETVAPATAVRHLERAFELWAAAGEAAATIERGDRLWQAAELASATIGYERAIELAREALGYDAHPLGVAAGHERLGRYLWAAGHLAESAAEYETAEALLDEDRDPAAMRVLAGLSQGELMLGRYDSADQRARRVDVVSAEAAAQDPAAWAMAQRVLGVVAVHRGDHDHGIARCRQALAAAPTAHTKALAAAYLGIALLDSGRYHDAVAEMGHAAAAAYLSGVDTSFGGYLDAVAAEALTRLGRWADAEALLGRHPDVDAFPVGAARLARAGALLAARNGDRDRAHSSLARANDLAIDPWHRQVIDHATAEAHVVLGEWSEAAAVVERASPSAEPLTLWRAQFVMLGALADVELVLDRRARGEPADPDTAHNRWTERIETARAMPGLTDSGVEHAHLEHAAAALTRLADPDPDAWHRAARQWERLGDRWWTSVCKAREAEAAVATGAAARAAEVLRAAHQLAVELASPPLLTDISAVSTRTRLSLDPPPVADLDDVAIDRLGLTSREAEVLALVAAGRTNRQIGVALYISEKTASVHVSNIMRKLGVSSRVDAAAVAQRLGVAGTEDAAT